MKPAYLGEGKYIFISYAHKDKIKISPFVECLQEKYNVWYDEGIHYGKEWEEEILEKLDGASIFLYLVTKSSLESQNCKDEIAYSKDNNINFINIIVDEIEIPKTFMFRFGRFQMCKLYEFSDVVSAINDLENKCFWFKDCTKKSFKKVSDNKINNTDNKSNKNNTNNELKIEYKANYKNIMYDRNDNKIYFGDYPQTKDGKKTPIEWDILEEKDGKALIISHYILDKKQFDAKKNTNYENSEIRHWLNNEFIDIAFGSNEKSIICITNVDNSGKSTGTNNTKFDCGNNTNDIIFLLSGKEAKTYFTSDDLRKAKSTDYAISQGLKVSNEGNSDWWLRSTRPIKGWHMARRVNEGDCSVYNLSSCNAFSGVRPCMWIYL